MVLQTENVFKQCSAQSEKANLCGYIDKQAGPFGKILLDRGNNI